MSEQTIPSSKLTSVGIGSAYHTLEISQFKGSEGALDTVKEYIEHLEDLYYAGVGIYAYGPPGSGKTFLMIEVLKAALLKRKKNRQPFSVKKTSLGEIVHSFTNTWYERESIARFEEDLIKVDYLLIDDLGKEYISEGSKGLLISALDKVIRFRVETLKPILITSNESPKFVATTFGDPLASLLAGNCRPIMFTGNDYRKEEKAEKKWRQVLSQSLS